MNPDRFSRRAALKLIGGGAALLPLLSTTRPLADTPPPPPKRLIIVFSTNGMIRSLFWPKTPGADFEMPAILEPLADFKSRMLLVGGLEQKVVSDNNGSGHHNEAFLLTGVKATPGQLIDDHNNPDTPFPRGAGGPSIDQYIASQLPVCSTLPFKSLQLGALTLGMPLSWAGSNQPLPANDDPYSVFELLFGDRALGPDALAKLRAERKSILDVVGGGLTRFSKRLGTDDRAKVDGHLQSIRELERQLDPNNAVNANCEAPAIGDKVDVKRPENYPTIIRAQTDLLVAALKCDATRIATLQFAENGAGHIVFPWLGSEFNASGELGGFGDSNAHHMISHTWHSSDANRAKKLRCEQWYMEQIAYLAQELDKVPEEGGTMLDNTAILYVNGMGEGASHYLHPLPAFIIGSCGGYFNTGRYVRYGNTDPASDGDFGTNGYQPHNRLLASLCNAMGVPATYYGDQQYGGPLDELV